MRSPGLSSAEPWRPGLSRKTGQQTKAAVSCSVWRYLLAPSPDSGWRGSEAVLSERAYWSPPECPDSLPWDREHGAGNRDRQECAQVADSQAPVATCLPAVSGSDDSSRPCDPGRGSPASGRMHSRQLTFWRGPGRLAASLTEPRQHLPHQAVGTRI